MTDTDDTPPGAGDPGPGRRRGVDQVAAELASLRRELTATSELLDGHAGHLAETLPRVDELTDTVAGLVAAVTALTREHDDQAREDAAELEARRAAGLADEPPAPWSWPVMDRPTAQAAYDSLGRWVATVLCGQYRADLGTLPGCWPLHPGAVAELSALRAGHVSAHTRSAHPAAALSWTRELPVALARVHGPDGAIRPDSCPPGHHHVDPASAPPERERHHVGRQPCSPDRWRPLLDQVAAVDISWRREPARSVGVVV